MDAAGEQDTGDLQQRRHRCMAAAVRRGLDMRRLEMTEDAVGDERRRRPKDEDEDGVDVYEIRVFQTGGRLTAVAKDRARSCCIRSSCRLISEEGGD
jgi:hypothetical protein